MTKAECCQQAIARKIARNLRPGNTAGSPATGEQVFKDNPVRLDDTGLIINDKPTLGMEQRPGDLHRSEGRLEPLIRIEMTAELIRLARDSKIIALARKVSIREDKTMTAQLPELRPARVTIHLRDGSILKAAVETNRGDWQDPYTDTALKEKFMALTTRLWPADQAEQIHTAIMAMEKHPIRDLFFPASGR